jgi:hypothetical protein
LRESTEEEKESSMRALHLRFIVTVVAFWIIATARVFATGDAGGPAISPTEALSD